MKKLILSLLAALGFSLGVAAAEAIQAQRPTNVINSLDKLFEHSFHRTTLNSEKLSNPETGMTEFGVEVNEFKCEAGSDYLAAAIKAFETDKSRGYQYSYFDAQNPDRCVVSTGQGTETLHKAGWCTWMLSVKNDHDPRLRDIYALSVDYAESPVSGVIYHITSPRPEMREAGRQSGGMFVLHGTVADNLTDSCRYVDIKIADAVSGNNAPSFRLPVENGEFNYTVYLDEPTTAQVRTASPSNWMNIYAIPGFTLDMTVESDTYVINNGTEYQAKASESKKMLASQSRLSKSNAIDRAYNLKLSIDAYKGQIERLNRQIAIMKTQKAPEQVVRELFDQIVEIYSYMNDLIDDYAREGLDQTASPVQQ